MPERRDWRRARFAVRAGRENLDEQHRQILGLLRRHRYRLWRTWELKEQLRDLYRTTDPADARAYLKRWCTAAKRSRIPAFANLVRRIEKHADAIVAAVELGLSNSRLEGINAKIRLIQRRAECGAAKCCPAAPDGPRVEPQRVSRVQPEPRPPRRARVEHERTARCQRARPGRGRRSVVDLAV
jgi:hypothetical protein